mmetsp:Transcript_43872/g.85821  ORF Transcript_43872/g.85821 Transcript_43872/m.85821 type:complete len:97 (+) Transcript_43872:1690-1980(+)
MAEVDAEWDKPPTRVRVVNNPAVAERAVAGFGLGERIEEEGVPRTLVVTGLGERKVPVGLINREEGPGDVERTAAFRAVTLAEAAALPLAAEEPVG